ncbi:MAG: redoxin family protein [Planctomycetes bacterium]|nr:redoxin family protein [Planctomycetota bacterium]
MNRQKVVCTSIAAAILLAALLAPGSTAQESDPKEPPAPKLAVKPGEPAPEFALPDHEGKVLKLSDFKGKVVVLEWFNPECPFVTRSHTEGSLKGLAARWHKQGVVWLAINSGAPGLQGHGIPKNRAAAAKWGMDHPILFDESGAVGRKYGALTTPHLFVIGKDGKLVYQGAIDSAAHRRRGAVDQVETYVEDVLTKLDQGDQIEVTYRRPYGCSVKYAPPPAPKDPPQD